MLRLLPRGITTFHKSLKSSCVSNHELCPNSNSTNKSTYSREVRKLNKFRQPSPLMRDPHLEIIAPIKMRLVTSKINDNSTGILMKRLKHTMIFVLVSVSCVGMLLVAALGKPKYDELGQLVMDQFFDMSTLKQYFLRTLNELDYYGQLLKEPSKEKLLPDLINHPIYRPKYTLVIEFTDVMVHPEWSYKTGWRYKKRPGLDNFLDSIKGVYEVVVYTAEEGMTVFPVVEALDHQKLIKHKLVKDATKVVDGKYIKDLDKLNRDLRTIIVVDWNENCTQHHRDNVLKIARWKGNDDDTDLTTLSLFLLAISQSQIEDVRDVLKVYIEYTDPLNVYKQIQKRLIEKAEADAEEERDKFPNNKFY